MFSTRHLYEDEFIQENLTTPEPANFDRWAAELEDVTTVNDKAANIYWAGESNRDYSFVNKRKTENFRDCWNISMSDEQLVSTSTDKYGNRLVRMWLNHDRNVTARIRYCKNNPHFLIEIFYNERDSDGRWHGQAVQSYRVHRTVTDEAETTVAKYVALELAKAQVNS